MKSYRKSDYSAGENKQLDQNNRRKQKKKFPPKGSQKPAKTGEIKTAKKTGSQTGMSARLASFTLSIRSLDTIFRERSKRSKKVEDINTLLDKTVSEKVSRSSASGAGNSSSVAQTSAIGGAGSLHVKEEDPFLSLSGDEFDEGLLADLDEQDLRPSGGGVLLPEPTDTRITEGDSSSLPEPDFSSEAENILKANASELDEFKGLDSAADTTDQDFEDLENINIDDVDLGDASLEITEEIPEESPASGTAAAPPSNQAVAPIGPVEVKNEWIVSDAPRMMRSRLRQTWLRLPGGKGQMRIF